ncbi:hypothetical protein [Streptomyces prasinus]|uniref:hypothetical protein n=1 Tax=Streptomyces prasinus TaxID=67345 RepID=UPI002F40C4CD
MGLDEYWVAISSGGELLGGGFFFTGSYVLTTMSCLAGLKVHDPVDLHTGRGMPLTGTVHERADDVGLALVRVRPGPEVNPATPQAATAVKGDEWYAPFRPSPATAALGGTVDEVAPGRRHGQGRPLCVIELASEREVEDCTAYAGGPVERSTEGLDPAVVGILLDPEFVRRLDDGAEDPLAAVDLHSAFEMFEALSAESLMRELCVSAAPPVPEELRAPSWEAEPLPHHMEQVRQAFEKARFMMREMTGLVEENPLLARGMDPYYMRLTDEVCNEAFRAMWGEREGD